MRKPGTEKITRVMAYDKARVAFWRNTPGGRLRYWLGDSADAWYAGVECTSDSWVHPVYPGDEPTGAPATGPVEDPFADPDSPVGHDECSNIGDV